MGKVVEAAVGPITTYIDMPDAMILIKDAHSIVREVVDTEPIYYVDEPNPRLRPSRVKYTCTYDGSPTATISVKRTDRFAFETIEYIVSLRIKLGTAEGITP